MSIQTLTQTELAERMVAMLKRSKAQLVELARLNGATLTGTESKAQLAALIVGNSARIEVEPVGFDFRGLTTVNGQPLDSLTVGR